MENGNILLALQLRRILTPLDSVASAADGILAAYFMAIPRWRDDHGKVKFW